MGVHTLYVPDFCDSNAQPNGPGAYFASIFSLMLQKRNKDFTVLNRAEVHRLLLQKQWTDCDLAKPDILRQSAVAAGADGVLTGLVTTGKNYFNVDLILRDASGAAKVHWVYQELFGPYTISSFPAAASPSGWPFYFPSLDGVSAPMPRKTQTMSLNYQPRKFGRVVISALVSAEGNIEQARVVQQLDPDQDKACLDAVKQAHLEPAKNSDGTPVPVRIMILFQFGKHRTYPYNAQYPEDNIP
jgi:TonB family protein